MIVVTSLFFAAYHWPSGIGNICVAFLLGVGLMLGYRRLESLWPVVLAH
jgi:membrane protease YdiL (CAAX protease family)